MTHTDVCSLCATRNGMKAPFAPPIFHTYDDFIDGDAKEATEEYDCIDTTRGVSKRMRFF